MLAAYVSIIVSQGDVDLPLILPWALSMTIAAVTAFTASMVRETRTARNLLIGAAALYGVLGVVAILTIGLGFLLIGALTVVAITRLESENQ